MISFLGEMAKSTQQEQIGRKRHPTPELKSETMDEAEHCRLHKNIKGLGKCLSTDNDPNKIRSDENRSLRIDTSTPRSKLSHTIVKSMSDIFSNRSRGVTDEPSIAPIDEDMLESPDSGLTLDANQATVGSAQTQWAKNAKDILSSAKTTAESDTQKQANDIVRTSIDPGKKPPNRPLLSSVFSQNSESFSESKQPDTVTEETTPTPEQTTEALSNQTSRDEETNNSTRRSRFPYRFKHHTVNLLTGSGVENRLIR